MNKKKAQQQKIHFILNRCEELLLLVVDIVYNSKVCICDFTFVYSPQDRIKVKIVYMHSHIHFSSFSFFLSFFGPIRKYICKKSRESVNVHTAENIFKKFKTVCCIKYLNNSSLYTLFLNVLFFLCSSLFLFFSIQRRVFIYFFRRHVAREKKKRFNTLSYWTIYSEAHIRTHTHTYSRNAGKFVRNGEEKVDRQIFENL